MSDVYWERATFAIRRQAVTVGVPLELKTAPSSCALTLVAMSSEQPAIGRQRASDLTRPYTASGQGSRLSVEWLRGREQQDLHTGTSLMQKSTLGSSDRHTKLPKLATGHATALNSWTDPSFTEGNTSVNNLAHQNAH